MTKPHVHRARSLANPTTRSVESARETKRNHFPVVGARSLMIRHNQV
jgi:hypothetical protein